MHPPVTRTLALVTALLGAVTAAGRSQEQSTKAAPAEAPAPAAPRMRGTYSHSRPARAVRAATPAMPDKYALKVPGGQHDVDFMVKDAGRFAESGGWGYAMFVRDQPDGGFRPGTTADMPPRGKNASCGFGCHGIAKSRDYVFTRYQAR